MRKYIKTELILTLIFIILGIFWIYFGEHLITGVNFKLKLWGSLENLCEVFFVIIASSTLYFSVNHLRRRIEQSGKEFQNLFEMNPVPTWIFDKKTLKFLLVNDAAIKTYGYSREEFLAMTIKDIRPEEEEIKLEDNLIKTRNGLRNTGIWKHKRKDGSIIIAKVSGDNVIINKKECRLISAHNVTTLFKAKDKMRESYKLVVADKELMRNAEELANFGSWELDFVSQALKCSDGMLKLYGYTDKNEPISFESVLEHIHPEDLNFVKRVYNEAIYNFTSPKLEFRIIGKNGIVKYIRSDLTIERNSQNDPIRLRGFNLDITETKLSIEKVRQSHKELQALAIHLENIREEERIDIARDIHDELGQQLTGIKYHISWIKSRLAPEASTVQETINEAMELVDDTIKSVRRIASKLRPIVLEENGLLAAIHWQTKDFEKRTGIQCTFTENFKPDDIDFDKHIAISLYRIYQEALTNITRYSGATCVDASLLLNQDYLLLQVVDNGKGFDPEEIKSKKTLGLIGMKERVLSMNAELFIQSNIGQGVSISIKIPRDQLYNQLTKILN